MIQKQVTLLLPITSPNVDQFFTVRLNSKYTVKQLLKIPPHLKTHRYTTLCNVNVVKLPTILNECLV